MSDYVTNDAWVRTLGRADAIDDIADQFERGAPQAAARPTRDAATRWPRSARGWRSQDRLHPRAQGERLSPG